MTLIEKHNETVQRRLAQVPLKHRRVYLNVMNGHSGITAHIKMMCLECVGWDKGEVERCSSTACPLYRIRPYVGEGTKLPKIDAKAKGVQINPLPTRQDSTISEKSPRTGAQDRFSGSSSYLDTFGKN